MRVNATHHVGIVPADDGCVHRYGLNDAELKSQCLMILGQFFDLPFPVTITFHYAN